MSRVTYEAEHHCQKLALTINLTIHEGIINRCPHCQAPVGLATALSYNQKTGKLEPQNSNTHTTRKTISS